MNAIFSVNYSKLSPNTLATEVLPKFGIGDISECVFFTGGFNDTYRVKTDDGQIFYLRVYRRSWRTLADIQYELDVLNYLKQKDFPAARPVSYQDGKLFCALPAPEGIRYLALFTEAAGPEISYDHEPQKVANAMGMLWPKCTTPSRILPARINVFTRIWRTSSICHSKMWLHF